jgi:hypothetical protein
MTYKRYVKRNGKVYGPYIYKSMRDENGNVKSIFIKKGKPENHKKTKFRSLVGSLIKFNSNKNT